MAAKICAVLGDITESTSDAIVNAANRALRGGGGVDGAIHRAAGDGLLRELVEKYPHGIATGEVAVTRGHDLPAKYVIHAVGPIWRGGESREAELLASCHREALRAAAKLGVRSIAFPAISCGIYGYPLHLAAKVAVDSVEKSLPQYADIEEVSFVLFSNDVFSVFAAEIDRSGKSTR